MEVLEKSKLVEIFVKSGDFCREFAQRQISETISENILIDNVNQLSTSN